MVTNVLLKYTKKNTLKLLKFRVEITLFIQFDKVQYKKCNMTKLRRIPNIQIHRFYTHSLSRLPTKYCVHFFTDCVDTSIDDVRKQYTGTENFSGTCMAWANISENV